MQQLLRPLAVLITYAVLALPRLATAQTPTAIPPAITTPDKVETRSARSNSRTARRARTTLDKVYDNLDFTHAFEAFVNTMQGVNAAAIRKGFLDIGVKDNEILDLLRLDGRQVAVPDGQRGHGLLRRASST